MNKVAMVFPLLNGLQPTVESCTMKLIEELGELLQLIGKEQGKSGELELSEEEQLAQKMIAESLDVAQSAVTMAHTLGVKHGIDLESVMQEHSRKLREKGYLI